MDRRIIKKIAKSLTASVLALTMVAASSTYIKAHADTLSDLKAKYKQLQTQQQQLQTKLNGLEGQVSDANEKKETISKNVAAINGQIDLLNKQIQTLDNQIAQTNKDIEQTEKDIKNNQKIYEERVCALYEAGNTSKAEILLSSKNVTDFFTKVETLKVISDHDNKLINDLKNEQAELQKEIKSLEDKKKSFDTAKSTISIKKMDLDSQLEEQKKIVSDLNSTKDKVADQKATVKQQATKTNAQINAQIAKLAEQRRQELIKSGTYKAGAFVNGATVVEAAKDSIGKPYVYGAAGPDAFDCSGLVQYCIGCAAKEIKAGDSADHKYRAIDLSGMGVAISRNNLQPGDVVFFATGGGAVNHCGIYIGDGDFIAANTGTTVRVMRVQQCSLSDPYWSRCYTGAQRIKL